MWLVVLLACSSGPPAAARDTAADTGGWPEGLTSVRVRVTLDGAPVVATVLQGGNPERWTTDRDGYATIDIDPSVVGDIAVLASHPDARIAGDQLRSPPAETVEIALVRFDATDNEAYVFADPGPDDYLASTTNDCVHCHVTIHHDWKGSVHASAAQNPVLHDLYAGTAAALDEAECAAAGGLWGDATEPGTGATVARCLTGDGVLDRLDGVGGCADCHAPGIDGALGGRDLLEATGVAYEAGVHCEVCHHVAEVDLSDEAGVAGALRIVRPSEAASSPAFGAWSPLTFGPFDDVVNPRMGSVSREHFHTGELCAGCHEQHQAALVPGAEVDLARWPEGRLPVHTTWSEWEASAMNPAAPCQSCHMPPDATVGNSSDLYNVFDNVMVGIAAGWERPAGEVRHHSWEGPRTEGSTLLQLAATLDVASTLEDGVLTAAVTVTNVGPGHALPTGEPLRNLLVLVEASCDGQPLAPTGGDVVPAYGGWLDRKAAGDDVASWPGAEVGDVLRYVRRTGAWRDYVGFGAFGDGTFAAEEKGLPEEVLAGVATIVAVDGDAVTLDAAPPDAWDVVYRVAPDALPADGDDAAPRAGAPGFGFARVLTGPAGEAMVPHYLAVDVASDNRLLPGAAWTSTHTFTATCDAPDVSAVLVHRAYPWALASARGWPLTESVMVAR